MRTVGLQNTLDKHLAGVYNQLMKLDQHFTSKTIAQKLFSDLEISEYDHIVEPSAGDGAFSDLIDSKKIIAIDIVPTKDYIIESDFLLWDYSTIQHLNNLVIGNPPFGYRAQLAIDFFNRSAKFASTIAFVLPRSFRKSFLINQLNDNFHLISDDDIPVDSFETETRVRTCWQIWERRNYKRRPLLPDTSSSDFVIVQPQKIQNTSEVFGIRRTSYSPDLIGEVFDFDDCVPQTQFIFIRGSRDDLKERFRSMKETLKEIAWNGTAMSPTFTVGELITEYNKKYRTMFAIG